MNWGLMHSRYSLTASMIDLGRIEDVVDALDSYSAEVISMVGFFNKEILLARSATEEYDGSHEYDLWHLLNNINYRTGCKRLDGLSAEYFRECVRAAACDLLLGAQVGSVHFEYDAGVVIQATCQPQIKREFGKAEVWKGLCHFLKLPKLL